MIPSCACRPVFQPCHKAPSAQIPRSLPQRCGAMTRSAAPSSVTTAQVSSLLTSLACLPRLIVFDLDYCLWPFWCEMYTIHDKPRLYPDVMPILDALRERGVSMALASRTPTPEVATAFLRKLGITDYFANIQLVPAADGYDQTTAQKDTAHFPNLRRELGIEYPQMLFFDDEHKNVVKVARLGVVSILVSSSTGVSLRELERGLREFAQQAGGAGSDL